MTAAVEEKRNPYPEIEPVKFLRLRLCQTEAEFQGGTHNHEQ